MEKKENPLTLLTHISMEEINPMVDALLGKSRQWDTEKHVSLIAALSMRAANRAEAQKMNKEQKLMFVATTLNQHGIAGNASQFRQWLASDKGGNRIDETISKNKVYTSLEGMED